MESESKSRWTGRYFLEFEIMVLGLFIPQRVFFSNWIPIVINRGLN